MRVAGSGFIATLAIAAALLAAEIASPTVVRVSSAILLLLVLPGLALTRVLFPERRLGAPETVLLSVALSIALAVVGALVLHATPFDLTRGSWAVLLAGVTVLAALVAQVRAQRDLRLDTSFERVTKRRDPIPAAPRIRRQWLINGALLGLALGVGISAISLARTPLPAKGIEGYTALWLLPGDTGRRTFEVGVQSSELETTRYRLVVRVAGTRVPPYRFELGTGGRWKARLRVERGFSGTVRALLYRASAPDKVYRRVRLLVDTQPPRTR